MNYNYYIPTDELGKALWLDNFSNKIGTYATKYGISVPEVKDMVDSNNCFRYWLDYRNKYNEYLKKVTAFKNQLSAGLPAGAVMAAIPVPPTVPVAPILVNAGIFTRAASLVSRIKGYTSYTEDDGKDLGIIATSSMIDFVNLKPEFIIRKVAGGQPEIVWTKQGLGGIDIYVCRDNTSNYSYLAFDSHPNYTDKAPLPANGTSQVWYYKIIYRQHDEQVGKWSNEVAVTVTGAI
jgi:hypothetical protein